MVRFPEIFIHPIIPIASPFFTRNVVFRVKKYTKMVQNCEWGEGGEYHFHELYYTLNVPALQAEKGWEVSVAGHISQGKRTDHCFIDR